MFDLRSARYFIAVAEELHFGRAAARLHMSQPPLSHAIRLLEEELGVELFRRANRKVTLTAAGEAFLSACRSLLLQAAKTVEVPRLVESGATATLTVGAVASALSWPLPQALALIRAKRPHVSIRIVEIDTDEAIELLRTGEIDIAIARLASSHSGVLTKVLLHEDFCALVPAHHEYAAQEEPLLLLDLAEDDWVWIAREVSPDYHDEMAAACRESGFSPRVQHWARSITSQIAIVQCGAGVSIIPSSASNNLPLGVKKLVLADAGRAVSLASSTRVNPELVVEELEELIEKIVTSTDSR